MACKRSFLEAIYDDVHCAICLDPQTEPHALKCLHTFCQLCIQRLLTDQQITCPNCRNITKDDELVSNFQIKRLVEFYKKQKTNDCVSEQESKPAWACELCQERPIEVHCMKCSRYVCPTCLKVHIITSRCQANHAVGLPQHLQQLKQMIGERLVELKTEKIMCSTIKERVIEETDSSYNECLESLEKCESRALNQVRQLFKEQKDKALEWRNAEVDFVNQDYLEMEAVTNHMENEVNDLSNTSSTSKESIDSHVHVLKCMDGQLTKQKTFDWTTVKFNLKNENMAVVSNHCPEVEKAEKHYTSGVDLEKAFVGITVHDLADVQGLAVANNTIVALLSGTLSYKLVELTDSGKELRVICDSGLGEAFGITSNRNEIIVASNIGLQKVSLDGQIIEIISEDSYQHCCTSINGLVYAIRSNKPHGSVYVDIMKNGSILQTIKTKLKQHRDMTCMMGPDSNIIFIACGFRTCIYEVGLPSGHLLGVFGCNGNTQPGDLKRPFLGLCSFSDLVIADAVNNQVQSFSLKHKTWKIIQLPNLLSPKCLAIKDSRLYVGGQHLFIYE